jgi:hypothetical protein
MALRPLVLVMLVSGSACVEGNEPVDPGATLGDQAQLVTSAQRDMDGEEEPTICDVLPQDGPCSHACDFATLSSFVPAGTCAVFHCDLLDGREISIHACRPGD